MHIALRRSKRNQFRKIMKNHRKTEKKNYSKETTQRKGQISTTR